MVPTSWYSEDLWMGNVFKMWIWIQCRYINPLLHSLTQNTCRVFAFIQKTFSLTWEQKVWPTTSWLTLCVIRKYLDIYISWDITRWFSSFCVFIQNCDQMSSQDDASVWSVNGPHLMSNFTLIFWCVTRLWSEDLDCFIW